MTIQLGDRVRDPITNFKGIVVGITTWLHGCIRCGVASEELKDGKPAEEVWFDQARLEAVDRAAHTPLVAQVVPAPPAPAVVGNGGPSREGSSFRSPNSG